MAPTAKRKVKTIRKAWHDHIERGKVKYSGTTRRVSADPCWKAALLILKNEQTQPFAEMTGPFEPPGFESRLY